MFSRILVKLIDQAIVPALLLLTARIVSVILISRWFDLNFELNQSGFVYSTPQDYVTVNSYSILFMIIALTLGLTYVLLKALVFHDTHVTPSLTAHLFALRLSSFIQTSFDVYSQGVVWMSYTYFLTICTALMAFFGMVFPWVFYVALVLTIVSTLLLVLDVESELDIQNKSDPIMDEESMMYEVNIRPTERSI